MSSDTPAHTSLEEWIEANGGVATLVFTDVVRATIFLFGTDSMVYMRAILLGEDPEPKPKTAGERR